MHTERFWYLRNVGAFVTPCAMTPADIPPPVELLHLLRGARSRYAVVTLAAVARPLPGGGAVDVVHVENSAVAVDASLPVCSGGTESHTEPSQNSASRFRNRFKPLKKKPNSFKCCCCIPAV